MSAAPKRKRLQRVSSTGSLTLSSDDSDQIITAKKVRQAPPTPKATPAKHKVASITLPSPGARKHTTVLPIALAHILQLHTSLESLLALKLASSSLAPSPHPILPNTLRITNVCTQSQLERAAGRRCTPVEVARLCWIYEGGVPISTTAAFLRPETPVNNMPDEDYNPFVTPTKPRPSEQEWVRGGTGVTISPMRVLDTETGKRRTVYAFGIEVHVGPNGGTMGMEVVARWLGGKEARVRAVDSRLRDWLKKNTVTPVPPFPSALLPPLIQPPTSVLTPASGRSASSTPSKPRTLPYVTPTPTRVLPEPKRAALMGPPPLVPETPTKPRVLESVPVTPANLEGSVTPSTGSSVKQRRSALYDRIAARAGTPKGGAKLLFRDAEGEHERVLTADELKRRSAVSRLGDVAEGVYMLFSSSGGGLATPATRRRRAIPMDEAVGVLVKSSKVAISEAEARSSLLLLAELCPFFVRVLIMDRAEWLEAPSSSAMSAPPSPGSVAVEEVASRSPGGGSPKRVRRPDGGLREVRERIRRELEGV